MKNFKKSSTNLLTKQNYYDIIQSVLRDEANKDSKNFQEILKKVLTNEKRYGIIQILRKTVQNY